MSAKAGSLKDAFKAVAGADPASRPVVSTATTAVESERAEVHTAEIAARADVHTPETSGSTDVRTPLSTAGANVRNPRTSGRAKVRTGLTRYVVPIDWERRHFIDAEAEKFSRVIPPGRDGKDVAGTHVMRALIDVLRDPPAGLESLRKAVESKIRAERATGELP